MEQLVINPYVTHSGVIFVSNKDFQESFYVRLIDKETKEKIEYYVKGLKGYHSEVTEVEKKTSTGNFN